MNIGRGHIKKLETVDWWDEYFLPDGGWEKNQGRLQTTVFAKSFVRYAKLDRDKPFSLLDVGCALGDAIRVFHGNYPLAKLYGIDISKTAISRCKSELGHIAFFEVKSIEEIDQFYDIIYISAVLEHFTDYAEKARHLIEHCKQLFIFVPYLEVRGGKPLEPNSQEHHQHTFDQRSFDFLIEENLALSIKTKNIRCPRAWSWTLEKWIKESLIKNPIRFILKKPLAFNPRMILFDIHSTKYFIPDK